jgi:hypothetical protein
LKYSVIDRQTFMLLIDLKRGLMDIQLAEQKIFALNEKITIEQARLRAMDKRTTLFTSGVNVLLQRIKPEEVELLATQKRWEPFWHVICATRQVYDRTRKFNVPVTGPEVQSITLQETDYPVANRSIAFTAVEHCREENRQQMFFDGVSGESQELGNLIGNARTEVTDLSEFTARDNTIVVPPEIRASYVMRQALQTMLKPVQADVIFEEVVTVEAIDLYCRPIFAFEFRWKTKDKTAVAEFDAVTGEMRNAKSLRQQLNIRISRDTLFDIGADTIGMVVPGGNIAVKLVKVAVDYNRKK